MKAVIIDDDHMQIELLGEMLLEHPEIKEISDSCDAEQGMLLVNEKKPDMVFLDINMPRLSGIKVAEHIKNIEKPPAIIFTTSYESYAVKAFDLDAIDYLVKPYSKERLYKAIDKARIRISQRKTKNSNTSKISVHEKDAIILLEIEDIYLMEACGRKTVIYTRNSKYETRETLLSLEEKLNKDFIRCHKSFLVNFQKISKIEPLFNRTYVIKFEEVPYKVPVSRKYGKELLELIGIQ